MSQNISIVTWIRAVKLNLKNPARFEDINKMENEFPQSGIFPPSGMHTPSFQIYESYYASKCSTKEAALRKERHINYRNSRI